MAKYFARVELHGADEDDYDKLHDALKAKGFTNCLKYNNGGSGKLPTGFYTATLTETDKAKVFDRVTAAANSTGLSSEIVVVVSNGSHSSLSKPCDS